ncbi:MAG TPA: hypothetical protein IAA78_09930 [Candidatus Avamphibacillus intestinigallinarum]|nr:hypothetical protein [Candidatus Avamphibacillus intestinigallinarum]
MNITKALKDLKQAEKQTTNKIFSMYLNTDPRDSDQQGNKWKINLKNGLRNFEQYVMDSNDKEELEQFTQVKKRVLDYIGEVETNLRRGVIIFASADQSVWFAERVQVRLTSEFDWMDTANIEQLEALQERYPKSGLILVQQNEIKIIETEMNEIENVKHYELDLETDDWKQKLGPQKVRGQMEPGAHNLQVDRFNNRYEANQQRWYKSIAPRIDKGAKEGEWKRIYVLGEKSAAEEIKEQMNKTVDDVIHKNMLNHDENEVISEVFL